MATPRTELRDLLRSNMFDGDEDGTVTISIARLLDEVVDIIATEGLPYREIFSLNAPTVEAEAHAPAAPTSGRTSTRSRWTPYSLGLARGSALPRHTRRGDRCYCVGGSTGCGCTCHAAPTEPGLDVERLGVLLQKYDRTGRGLTGGDGCLAIRLWDLPAIAREYNR